MKNGKGLEKAINFLIIFLIIAFLTSCTGGESADVALEPEKEIMVSAAASLTEAVTEISENFQEETGIEVVLNFSSSGSLQKQIEEGAPADIFLSASKSKMDKLEEKDLIDAESRKDYLNNHLVLIVSEEYKDEIKSIEDLLESGLKLSVGEPESVPAGKYAKQSLEYYDMWDKLAGQMVYAKTVKQVAQYVESGDSPAGIVYMTDTTLLKHSYVNKVFDDESHTPIVYPLAIIRDSKNKDMAEEYIEYLQNGESRSIFVKYNFEPLF
ncbi:molybdate transport system substrate-binding protein [Dethiosulfatibacter aminovorans DSM 17477]|uniref:Molybdate transport system substrate-binding protein n=1 Tax=Dethiosulfatibacter aminovorans DSM 17477 TaxID=1121476 RepID=A0A1M6CDQ3_9FIRM|nr:molybdate ABC transporter substrate-binding protein [Dethiosulfatibacter aminovorans]SHI59013.1 molybdate transport system substrate-binding protein [Dethiosulfatibacter aminovorans DSM 17477]